MTNESPVNQTMVIDPESVDIEESAPERIVAGYRLQDLLGVGGYGEVWRGIGPGGLAKAVKILHGDFDGPTAGTELKALELIRELRHPFLLNIERIEICNNRLVIVTELAECSMEEKFEQLQREGKPGIPREQLLGYLRDAADALDFMHEEQGLQHLDIKPGNLLIQGGHVKVADFGLIKDVRQTNVSMIGGFTPLYTPPELFEGEPNRASDQYSLAIVYQIMLTGTPPFSGRTAAQLTAQQMSSKPDLSVLSTSDRSAISRALSKNAKARFPSCRDFVDSLINRRTSKARVRTSNTRKSSDDLSTGILQDSASTSAVRSAPRHAPSKPLSPIELQPEVAACRPTLFVSIGGLAGQVLSRLEDRLSNGGNRRLPAFPMICIDTDTKSLTALTQQGKKTGLTTEETLSIPLRNSAYYRAKSRDVLDWLSRRWLFNIPRTRQVEGFRPLGRLAFVDHEATIRSRITNKLQQTCDEQSVQATQAVLGLPMSGKHCDVVVVSSLTGGTGGGASLDMGYLLREIMASLPYDECRITGMLLHATGQKDQQQRIQRVNSISCLKELRKFAEPDGGFPGAPACGIGKCNLPPFDETYVVHLGDGCSDLQLAGGLQRIAEYLYQQTATPMRAFFEHHRARNPSEDVPPAELKLRSFDLVAQTVDISPQHESIARELVAGLFRQWNIGCGLPKSIALDESSVISRMNGELEEKLELQSDQLVNRVTQLSAEKLLAPVQTFLDEHLELETVTPQLFTQIDQLFEETNRNHLTNNHPATILAALGDRLTQRARENADQIGMQILALSDRTEARLETTFQGVADMLARLERTATKLAVIEQQQREDRKELIESATTSSRKSNAKTSANDPAIARKYLAITLCNQVMQCFRSHVDEVRSVLGEFAGRVEDAMHVFMEDLQGVELDPRALPLLDAFHKIVREDESISLGELIQSERQESGIPRILIEKAILFLTDAGAMKIIDPSSAEGDSPSGWNGLGGNHRIVAALHKCVDLNSWKQRLTKPFGNCVTIDPRFEHSSVFVCAEQSEIPLERVIERISVGDPTLQEMASRVHTRIDIDW